MWQELAIAFSLVLIIEGIIPFVSPSQWRAVVMSIAARSDDRQVRLVGFISMISGVALLYWVH